MTAKIPVIDQVYWKIFERSKMNLKEKYNKAQIRKENKKIEEIRKKLLKQLRRAEQIYDLFEPGTDEPLIIPDDIPIKELLERMESLTWKGMEET